jgi:hypothetical protein
MRAGELKFLVTAAHVGEQFDGLRIATVGRDSLVEVGRRRIGYRSVPEKPVDTDLAVIELGDAEASELSGRFSFSSRADLDEVGPDDRFAFHCLVGYPASQNRPKPTSIKQLVAKVSYVAINKLADEVQPYGRAKDSRVHFAFGSRRTMVNAELTPITPPKPNGMSGGGVWRINVDQFTGTLGAPKLVGIGIEHNRRDNVFIATRIRFVLPLLRDLMQSDSSPSGT